MRSLQLGLQMLPLILVCTWLLVQRHARRLVNAVEQLTASASAVLVIIAPALLLWLAVTR